jgi:hypothetical protein
LKLMLALSALAAAPFPALAQTWPAGVVAGGPRMADAPTRVSVLTQKVARAARRTPPVALAPAPALRLSTDDEVPHVDVRPKDEWRDDEGLRVTPTRVAFKRRF